MILIMLGFGWGFSAALIVISVFGPDAAIWGCLVVGVLVTGVVLCARNRA